MLTRSTRRPEKVQVLLTFGRQDIQGFSTILDLKDLLASLEPVVYCENENGTDTGTDTFNTTKEENSHHNRYYHILHEKYCHGK